MAVFLYTTFPHARMLAHCSSRVHPHVVREVVEKQKTGRHAGGPIIAFLLLNVHADHA
jgi:hypothetical protein